jgi:hypothetical protein
MCVQIQEFEREKVKIVGSKKDEVNQHLCYYSVRLSITYMRVMDPPYYSESEICGGAVTISFSTYLPWQAMHFLQLNIHFSKTCSRPLITSKFLAMVLPFHGWKSPEIAWGEI